MITAVKDKELIEPAEQTNASSEGVSPESQPDLRIKIGRTTFLVNLHFNENSKETLDDKVKQLIRKDVENGNF